MALRDLRERILAGEAAVAGCLSGTSADGIDVALVRFAASAGSLGFPELVAFDVRPFPAELGARLRALLDGASVGPREIALLDRDLGRAFGSAVDDVASEHGVRVELTGSHGQTVWHHDGAEESGSATLQLGDGDEVSERARATVVSDFRARDIARGGEGAPLSALADDLVFHALPRPAAVLNLGGMANLTVLAEGEPALAFDTGPANSLLDGLARELLGAPFDASGRTAKSGRAHPGLVRELLAHEFFRRAPPKSTGRDTFGAAYARECIARARALGVVEPSDLLASAVDVVAQSVADALERHAPRELAWLVLTGGGVHNQALVDALALRARQPVASAEDFGVDPDAREALVFAVLAARCVLEEPVTSPRATGARAGAVLGKLSPWSA